MLNILVNIFMLYIYIYYIYVHRYTYIHMLIIYLLMCSNTSSACGMLQTHRPFNYPIIKLKHSNSAVLEIYINNYNGYLL